MSDRCYCEFTRRDHNAPCSNCEENAPRTRDARPTPEQLLGPAVEHRDGRDWHVCPCCGGAGSVPTWADGPKTIECPVCWSMNDCTVPREVGVEWIRHRTTGLGVAS